MPKFYARKQMNYLLIFLSVFFVAAALLSAIWILVPAPSYYIWLYSVAVSEWSLWFGALGLLGITLAWLNYILYKNGVILIASIIVGGTAFLISLYPFFSALSVAREKGVSLSFSQYFSGLTGDKAGIEFKTYVFKGGATDLKMDVYTPSQNTAANGAGVVVVHGGSWNAGGRGDFPQWNAWLAANGFTVFDVDYTLAPQPNYRTAIGDVKCAVQQIKKRSTEFKISPDKIVLLGRSAGAQLALMAAYSANDPQFPATCGDDETRESVRAIVSFYAPTDLIWDYDNPANQFVINGPQTLSDFLGGSPHESEEIRARFALASPNENIRADTPPTLLMHGGYDQLVRKENLAALAAKLNLSNVAHETLFIPYAQHGFDYNFNGWGSQIVKPVLLDFLIKNTQTEKNERQK